jgi:hypothetical protein
MANPWYPNAIRHEGAHANYEAGQVLHVSAVVCHFTVGVNSIGTLGRDFTFLVDRDGDVHQGAPVDARVYHAGEPWNSRGPGIEVEYHWLVDDAEGDGQDDEDVMTEAQVAALHALVAWLRDEWGVTFEYYDGPRIYNYQGFIAHRAVIQSGDWHSDYWPASDAVRIFAATAPPAPAPTPERYEFDVFKMHSPTRAAVVTEDEVYTCAYSGTMPFIEVDDAVFDYIVNDVRAKFAAKLEASHAQRDVRLV